MKCRLCHCKWYDITFEGDPSGIPWCIRADKPIIGTECIPDRDDEDDGELPETILSPLNDGLFRGLLGL